MFERLKSLFKKKPVSAIKELSLEEAEKFFREHMKSRENAATEKCRSLQTGMLLRFKNLNSFFNELASAEVREERAASSKVVKDRFAGRALDILKRISDSNIASLDDAKKFAYDISDVLNALGNITPKQAIHIQFFFGEQMSKIALEIEEIIKETKALNDVAEPVFREKESLEKIFHGIKNLKDKMHSNEEKISHLLDDIVDMKKLKEDLVLEDLSELDALRAKLREMMSKRTGFKHRIDAEFSAVGRLLKKYRYHEQYALKETKLLDMYIEEPYEAFLEDDELKIKKFLENAVLLATAGDIDIDVKTIQKVESIFDSFDELKEMKAENAEISQEISELEEVIQKNWMPKAEQNKAIERKIKELDEKILAGEKNHMAMLKENERNENQGMALKNQLSDMLTQFSAIEVKIL